MATPAKCADWHLAIKIHSSLKERYVLQWDILKTSRRAAAILLKTFVRSAPTATKACKTLHSLNQIRFGFFRRSDERRLLIKRLF